MRVAISANENNGLNSAVSSHFGRCPYFVLVDVEGQEVKAIQTVPNPYYGIQPVTGAAGTAGHALEQFLSGGLEGGAPCRESIEHGHEKGIEGR
jgi:predicted Fe-Mo cluster-binding NifX family protein